MSERPSPELPPLQPFELPPDLAAFLQTQEYGCLMQETSEGTAFIVKVPIHEIVSLRGPLPIRLGHELYSLPQAPVIRTLLSFYDQIDAPLVMETFTNVADPSQAADFRRLATQERFPVVFYDEGLRHQLTKLVPQPRDPQVMRMVDAAVRIRESIPAQQYDFDEAKAEVMRRRRL